MSHHSMLVILLWIVVNCVNERNLIRSESEVLTTSENKENKVRMRRK